MQISNVELRPRSSADRTLSMVVGFWFLALVIGQWVFLYCMLAVYGPPTLSGDFQAWNVNPFLRKGYVAGDAAGNFAFAAHVLVGAAIAFGGTLQLVPQIRKRALAVHRWNGRVFLLAATTGSVAGLYMVWVRGAGGDAVDSLANTIDAALILLFAALAWRTAHAGNIESHRRWALRTFMVANGVFFIRIGVLGWMALQRSQVGAVAFHIFAFACYLVPLAILELYLFVKDRGGSVARYAMAVALLAVTAFMSVGTFAFYQFMSQRVLSRL